MKTEQAELLVQCHCPGLPGTEDPRITKAVKAAEREPAARATLARQRAFDEGQMTAVSQLMVPQAVLARIEAGSPAKERPFSGKGALLQPVVLAIGIAAAVLIAWGGVLLYNRAHNFPGKDSAMRMVEVTDEMTGAELEPKKTTAAALNDWFFDKYGFEDYYVPPGFENYQAAGARLFLQDGSQVAQVAIEEHSMMFYSFKAEDFGVSVPSGQWQTFTDGEWVAALMQQDEECFIVAFRGTSREMEDFLASKK